MANQEPFSINEQSNDHQDDTIDNVPRRNEGDTYPISDNESTTNSIDENFIKLPEQGEFTHSLSEDSLTNSETDQQKNRIDHPSSQINSKFSSKMSTIKSTTTTATTATSNLFRSMPLDEHIKLVKQKKEEAEILRLQKFQEQLQKKEQKWQQQQVERVKKWLQLRNRDNDHRLQVEERRRKREEEAKAKIDDLLRREKEREQRVIHNRVQKADSAMSMSTDVVAARRAISASRLRSNQPDSAHHRRGLNDSVEENSHLSLIFHDEQANDHSIDESLLSGILDSSSVQPMSPTTHVFWINTGAHDTTSNPTTNVNFMRATFATKYRAYQSDRLEHCPRAGKARDEVHPSSNLTNGDSQRRITNSTIRRLAKPKMTPMAQSVHIAASSSAATTTKKLPLSRSSHQLRLTTPPVSTSATTNRRHPPSRPATVPTSTSQSRTSPADEPSSIKTSSHRPKLPTSSAKPPTLSTRSKPPTQRSLMTTSHSSSSLTSSTMSSKRHLGATSPSKSKPVPLPLLPPPPALPPSLPAVESESVIETHEEEGDEHVPVPEETICPNEPDSETVPPIKREQVIDEQEYQRKLNQKIREAQQRLELERQREEERQRQLELEELEREREQIRLVEEQRRAEQERLQRAIEERERENELKRQEEQRLQQQRELLERKQAEEAERLLRERQERARKEEEERNERKKRLDLIMRRTRQTSPHSKQENTNKPAATEQTNGHESFSTTIPHSISDNRFPTSISSENFLTQQESVISPTISSTSDTPKFKSPLIQSLLNKARNTRSTDNLVQTSMTTSQIIDETAAKLTTPDDDHHLMTNSNHAHPDLLLSTSYHDRPMEATAAYQ